MLHLGEEVVRLFVVGGLSIQPTLVFLVRDVLVRRVLEHLLPTISIEVWQVVGCRNGGTPIVEDDVELQSNVACLIIENKGNGAGVLVGEVEVDSASGAGRPIRQLFPVRDHLVEDEGRASPNVYIR